MVSRTKTVVALVVGLSACGKEQSGTGGSPELEGSTDSEIHWELTAVPRVSIGGEETPLFRVSDALLSASGEIVISDAAPRILFFDLEGREKRSVGRVGDGPGEFRSIEWIEEIEGDSLVAYDPRLRRVTYFSSSGEPARFVRPEAATEPRGVPQLVGTFPDGTLVATQIIPPENPPHDPSFIIRPDLRLMRYSRAGLFQADLGQVPGPELAYVSGVRFPAAPFLRNTFIALGPDQIYVAPGDDFGALVLDQHGVQLREISRPHTPVPVQESDLPQSHAPDGTPFPHPPEFPAISSILIDAAGQLWVRPFTRRDSSEVEWSVFDEGGQYRGSVTLPGRFEPMDVGEDYVLGVARDSLDVETVHLYGLSRRGGTSR